MAMVWSHWEMGPWSMWWAPRNEVVGNRESDGSEDQADGIVYVHPIEVGLIRSGREVDGDVAGDIDKRGPQDAAHDVPERDIHLFVFSLADGGENINSEHDPSDDHQGNQR